MNHLSEQQLSYLQELLDTQETATRIRARIHALDCSDEAEVADAMNTMECAELADIAAARVRMADQQYGMCIDCGDAIPYARLEANVTAKRCAPCQQVYESVRRN